MMVDKLSQGQARAREMAWALGRLQECARALVYSKDRKERRRAAHRMRKLIDSNGDLLCAAVDPPEPAAINDGARRGLTRYLNRRRPLPESG